MELLLLTFTFVTCLGVVHSATNITSCTSLLNDQCEQNLTSCSQPPCTFSCGRTSPQFSCRQDCSPIPSANLTEGNLCDALECQASENCNQICLRVNCNATSCTSRDCRQTCTLADCGSMVCQQGVINCVQVAQIPQRNGQIMNCDAKSCNQKCQRSSKSGDPCVMSCSETVETCKQRGLSAKFRSKCLGGVKNCTQNADLFAIGHMECDAERCVQACFHSSCIMNCSSRARECTQTEDGFGSEVITMHCAADVCKQHCDDTKCKMTCASTVKECSQTCKGGNCAVTCDAEICYGEKGISTANPTWIPPTNGVSNTRSALLTLCLVLMFFLLQVCDK